MTEEMLDTSNALLELIRYGLCPYYLTDAATVALTVPGSEEDYRVGVYLYDIQDYSALIPDFTMIGQEERQYPPKAVELSYCIFCNESKQFGGVKRDKIQALLNQIIRVIHDNPVIDRKEGKTLQLSFAFLDLDLKIKLWGSFQQALQPAVYIKAVPVLIASDRVASVPVVKERDYRMEKKE